MLEFAGDAYPELDRQACLAEIDRLGASTAAHTRDDSPQGLAEISRLLYEDEHFTGNRVRYEVRATAI